MSPLTNLNFNYSSKNTCSTMTAWNYVGLLQSKSEMIYVAKNVCLTTIHRNTTHILDIIMEILKYVCSYTICMFVYFSLQQKPLQLCLNVLPLITKHYKHG